MIIDRFEWMDKIVGQNASIDIISVELSIVFFFFFFNFLIFWAFELLGSLVWAFDLQVLA